MIGSVTPDRMATDAAAFFDFLAGRPEVRGDRFGVCGYCMGGRTVLIVAGPIPERVAAAGSFHGGGLVTDDETGPHLLADRVTGTVLVAGAQNDKSFTTEQAETLDKALTAAGVQTPWRSTRRAMGSRCPTMRPMTRRRRSGTGSRCRELFASSLPS